MDLLDPSIEGAASVAYSGTAGTTSTFRQRSQGVLVWTTTDAYVKVGETVVATTADTPIPAYVPVIFKVPKGSESPWRVSAIQVSTAGTVFAKPVNGAVG